MAAEKSILFLDPQPLLGVPGIRSSVSGLPARKLFSSTRSLSVITAESCKNTKRLSHHHGDSVPPNHTL